MPKKKTVIPAATMAQVLRMAGAERVAEPAAKDFANLILEKSMEIAKDAVRFSKHAGRKTVKREDIELARKGI